MVTLKMSELVGVNCITPEDGLKVGELIKEHLAAGRAVTLDFANVSILLSVFLNPAVGSLLKEYSEADFRTKVFVTNLPEEKMEVFEMVVENAVRYFHDEQYRKALDTVLEEDKDH